MIRRTRAYFSQPLWNRIVCATLLAFGAVAAPSNAMAQREMTDIHFSTELPRKSQELLNSYGMRYMPMLPGEQPRSDAEWQQVIGRFDAALQNQNTPGIQDMSGLFEPETARLLGMQPRSSAPRPLPSALNGPARMLLIGLAQSAARVRVQAAQAGDGRGVQRWQEWANYYAQSSRSLPANLTTGQFLANGIIRFRTAAIRANKAGYRGPATTFLNTSIFWTSLARQLAANQPNISVQFPPDSYQMGPLECQRLMQQHAPAFAP